MTPSEVAEELRLGRSTVYRLLQSGQIKSVLVGGSRRVRAQDLADYLAALPTQTSTTRGDRDALVDRVDS
jgi:excisionase family DNA binding protein